MSDCALHVGQKKNKDDSARNLGKKEFSARNFEQTTGLTCHRIQYSLLNMLPPIAVRETETETETETDRVSINRKPTEVRFSNRPVFGFPDSRRLFFYFLFF
jgi:hypothetical protein